MKTNSKFDYWNLDGSPTWRRGVNGKTRPRVDAVLWEWHIGVMGNWNDWRFDTQTMICETEVGSTVTTLLQSSNGLQTRTERFSKTQIVCHPTNAKNRQTPNLRLRNTNGLWQTLSILHMEKEDRVGRIATIKTETKHGKIQIWLNSELDKSKKKHLRLDNEIPSKGLDLTGCIFRTNRTRIGRVPPLVPEEMMKNRDEAPRLRTQGRAETALEITQPCRFLCHSRYAKNDYHRVTKRD